MHKNPRNVGCVNLKQVLSDIRDDCQDQRSNKRVFSKPTGIETGERSGGIWKNLTQPAGCWPKSGTQKCSTRRRCREPGNLAAQVLVG
jgi:hypothetical protein